MPELPSGTVTFLYTDIEGSTKLSQEHPDGMSALLGAAEVLRASAQAPMMDYEQIEYDQSVAQLRSMLSEPEFNLFWSEGRALTVKQAIQLALEKELPHDYP